MTCYNWWNIKCKLRRRIYINQPFQMSFTKQSRINYILGSPMCEIAIFNLHFVSFAVILENNNQYLWLNGWHEDNTKGRFYLRNVYVLVVGSTTNSMANYF